MERSPITYKLEPRVPALRWCNGVCIRFARLGITNFARTVLIHTERTKSRWRESNNIKADSLVNHASGTSFLTRSPTGPNRSLTRFEPQRSTCITYAYMTARKKRAISTKSRADQECKATPRRANMTAAKNWAAKICGRYYHTLTRDMAISFTTVVTSSASSDSIRMASEQAHHLIQIR